MSVPFGEVLTQEPVGVFVRASLPWGLGVTEADVDAGVDRELGVLSHLFALIPGQRLPEMIREALHGLCQGATDGFGGVAVGQREQHHVAGPAFHQGPGSRSGGFPSTSRLPNDRALRGLRSRRDAAESSPCPGSDLWLRRDALEDVRWLDQYANNATTLHPAHLCLG